MPAPCKSNHLHSHWCSVHAPNYIQIRLLLLGAKRICNWVYNQIDVLQEVHSIIWVAQSVTSWISVIWVPTNTLLHPGQHSSIIWTKVISNIMGSILSISSNISRRLIWNLMGAVAYNPPFFKRQHLYWPCGKGALECILIQPHSVKTIQNNTDTVNQYRW